MLTKAAMIALAFGLVQALPQPRAIEDNLELIAKLKTDATAFHRFQRLLTENGQLISADKLTKATVFNFNDGVPIPGTKGGSTAIVSTSTLASKHII